MGAFVHPASTSTGGLGSFLSLAPRNFAFQNTDPAENSAVFNTYAWIYRNFGQALFGVCKETTSAGKTVKKPLPNHPLQQLLERPNPFQTQQEIYAGLIYSYQFAGDAYLIKVRNARGAGFPTELWYEPHWSIKPHWPSDGSQFIDYYERTVNGRTYKIPVEDVIHIRNGINPANPRYGLAPIRAALLQIYGDNEVDRWVASLARNVAIPGVIMSPVNSIGMTSTKADEIKQTWKRKFGGDNKGEPLILDFEATIQTLGFDPKNMEFKELHNHAESRIAGATGVPPGLTYANVANQASTYENMQTYERLGWEQCLIPMAETFEDAFDRQLLVDFEQDPVARGIYCEFDTSRVRALKENQDAKEKRAREAFLSSGLTWNEYREQLGLQPDEANGAWLFLPTNGRPASVEQIAARAAQEITDQVTAPTSGDTSGKPPTASAGKRLPVFSIYDGLIYNPQKSSLLRKLYDYEGLTVRREPTELEKTIGLKAISDAMDSGKAQTANQLALVRRRLIEELADELATLEAEQFNQVTADASDDDRAILTASLGALFVRGAQLVYDELRRQGAELSGGAIAEIPKDVIITLANAALTGLSNDVRARAIASAIDAVLVEAREGIAARVRADLDAGSTAYVDRAGAEASNVALARGRAAEAEARGVSEIIYSAVLDLNTCGPCSRQDGVTASAAEQTPVPNPDCEGGASCRCLWIAVWGL